jgi:hypothetical protein
LLLASLSPGDLAALQPHLRLAYFEQEQVLFEAGDTIEAAYFPTSAVISIVVTLSSGQVVEAAMVGRDGVIGASAALDGKMSLSRAVIQLSGEAMVCSLAGLRGAARIVPLRAGMPSSLSATGSSQLHRSGVSDLSKPTQGSVTTIGTFNYFAGDDPTGSVFFAASWKKRTRTLKGDFHFS